MGAARLLRGATGTITHTFVLDEDPTDSSTTVTVAVVDATGGSVSSGNATSAGIGTGTYTYVLAAGATLEDLTATWTGTIGGVSRAEADNIEVVGGTFFDLATGRNSDATLADTTKYPTADLRQARLEVEQECEQICDRAFFPRYAKATLDGTGTADLLLPSGDTLRRPGCNREVRSIRSVTMASAVDGTFTAFTAGELAALAITPDGAIRRTDGAYWTRALSNVVVEWEFGLDSQPQDLIRAALVRFRSRLNIHRTGVPDRATSFTTVDGGTYRIDLPGAWKTGLPEVDAVYARYSHRSGAGTGTGRMVPASRTLSYDPQHGSVFHGGRR
jgi:hypothetical protein